MSRTLNNQLIRNTTAIVTTDNKVSYSYPKTRNGLENTYSVLGLNVYVETTKERGWNLYETSIRISYANHWGTPDGFSEWLLEYKTSLGITARYSFITHSEDVENHSASKIAKAHEVGLLASEIAIAAATAPVTFALLARLPISQPPSAKGIRAQALTCLLKVTSSL